MADLMYTHNDYNHGTIGLLYLGIILYILMTEASNFFLRLCNSGPTISSNGAMKGLRAMISATRIISNQLGKK
jgi:hypothetical protein